MNPTKIILHHSLTKDGETVSMDAIRRYHIDVQGWTDIGYHYILELVDNRYEIFKGRMDNEPGAHCLGFNDSSIGICLVGDFDQESPCIKQLALLKKLCNSLQQIYGIDATNVIGHWESYALRNKNVEKSCPGNAFSMTAFRRSL